MEKPSPVRAPDYSTSQMSRRTWLQVAAGVSAAVALAGTGLAMRELLRRPKPVDFRMEGSRLITLDAGGHELWHATFSESLRSSEPDAKTCVFADLDGDGRTETLFRKEESVRAFPVPLVCFSDKGKLRWQFEPMESVIDSLGREFHPPFAVSDIEVVRTESGRGLLVAATCLHHFSFPCQVVLLDAHGRKLRQYWHRGHLNFLKAMGGRIVLGGVNDAPEYKQATVVTLEPANMAGGSVSPAGEPYFHGVAPGPEVAEIFFPRTRMSTSKEFNRVAALEVLGNHLQVVVAEDTDQNSTARVVYDFDFDLRLRNVAFVDALVSRYIEIAGDRDKGIAEARQDEEKCRADVRVRRRAQVHQQAGLSSRSQVG